MGSDSVVGENGTDEVDGVVAEEGAEEDGVVEEEVRALLEDGVADGVGAVVAEVVVVVVIALPLLGPATTGKNTGPC